VDSKRLFGFWQWSVSSLELLLLLWFGQTDFASQIIPGWDHRFSREEPLGIIGAGYSGWMPILWLNQLGE